MFPFLACAVWQVDITGVELLESHDTFVSTGVVASDLLDSLSPLGCRDVGVVAPDFIGISGRVFPLEDVGVVARSDLWAAFAVNLLDPLLVFSVLECKVPVLLARVVLLGPLLTTVALLASIIWPQRFCKIEKNSFC